MRNSVTVLVCEDSSFLRSRIHRALLELPQVVEIQVADDAATALKFINLRTVGFIILDLSLRQSSGFEVLAAVSKLANPPEVLVFTSDSSGEVRTRCLAAGAIGFFDKASGIEPLMERLAELAGGLDLT